MCAMWSQKSEDNVSKIEYLHIKGYMRAWALAVSSDMRFQSNSAETLGL